MEDTQIDARETSLPALADRTWWEKPLLILILGMAATLMLAWLVFLGWMASWLLVAIWP